MIKVLVIGEGGRECAIASTLHKDGAEIYAYMSSKNPGIARISRKIKLGNLLDLNSIVNFAYEEKIDFAICGPEAPLVAGIADLLDKKKIPCIGPYSSVAKIEGSKSYARNLMKKYNIKANPKFIIINNLNEARKAIDVIKVYAIKPDGLTGGKGVKILGEHLFNKNDTLDYIAKILPKHKKVIIEEKMNGEEFVLQCFCDGKKLIPFPLVHDHKRAYDDDKGPNTGGMGSISFKNHLLPFIDKEIYERAFKIMQETYNALKKEEKIEYKGILYGQFMITKEGPKIVEYNVRFGDPEAMNILPLLKTNFVKICEKIIDKNLSYKDVIFDFKSSVCIYLAPEGYPEKPLKNQKIQVNEKEIIKTGAKLFYASLNEINNQLYTTGSRSIAIVGISEEIENARKICYSAVKHINGKLFYRKDIGSEYLINKRINNLKKLKIIS